MKYSKILFCLIASPLILINHSALARPNCDHGFYADLLAGYGKTTADKEPLFEFNGRNDGAAVAVTGGYHFARHFGIDVSYQHFPTATDNQDFGTVAAKFIFPLECYNTDVFLKVEALSFFATKSSEGNLTNGSTTITFKGDDRGSKNAISLVAGTTYWFADHLGATAELKYGIGSTDDSIGHFHVASAMIGLSAHS